jgi:hypothetical protein
LDLHRANKCKPKSSLERFLNVTSRTSNLHYPYTECKPFYQRQSQPYSHLRKLSYPISVFLNTMAFTSICLLFSHYDFLSNVSAVSVCKWCWIVLTYAGVKGRELSTEVKELMISLYTEDHRVSEITIIWTRHQSTVYHVTNKYLKHGLV